MKAQSIREKCVWLSMMAVSLVGFAAQAEVRLEFPADFPGPPYYARITQQFVIHTDKWAAIVFYRQPSCVPPNFNLLNLFDPGTAPGCPLTIDGFALFDQNPPLVNFPPRKSVSFGLGSVPVAFVRWPELQAAIADGVLTIGELAKLPSLRMVRATFFHENLRPTPISGIGGSEDPKLTIVARGAGFELKVKAKGNPLTLNDVTIEFR